MSTHGFTSNKVQPTLSSPDSASNYVSPACDARRVQETTSKVLKTKQWEKLHVATLKGKLKQVKMLEKATGLPMTVVSATALAALGHIPLHTATITAEEALHLHGADVAARPRAVIVFFSHRWLTPSKTGEFGPNADDEKGTKWRALTEWARWIKWALKQPNATTGLAFTDITRDPAEIYFWIDQTCTAKENPAPVIAGLPGYVACSHLLLCYHTPDYEERAWCRVERMMAYALLTAGDVVFVVKEGFEHAKQPVLREDEWVITDPAKGRLTFDSDREHIRTLSSVALECKAFTTSKVFTRLFTSDWFTAMMWCVMCCACCGVCAKLKSRRLELNTSKTTALILQKGL